MISQYIDSLFGTFSAHPYIFLFIGLLFVGETVLLPAIYFTLSGKLHLPYVIAIALVATLLSDVFWYYIGAHIKNRFARKIVSGRLQKNIEKLSGVFARRGETVLFISKFVYGTRTATQILAGLQPMRFRKYISINFLGIFSLLMFLVALAYSIDATVENIRVIMDGVKIAFLIFIIILALIYFSLGTYFKKIWLQ